MVHSCSRHLLLTLDIAEPILLVDAAVDLLLMMANTEMVYLSAGNAVAGPNIC